MYLDLCRHIKSNGMQCRAVALTDSHFCYFHRKLNHGHSLYRSRMAGAKSLMERGHIIALPALEDRVSVQLALSEVINALACNFIDAKRANALFFGLKLAMHNCKGSDFIPQPTEVVRDFGPAPGLLESVAVDLAPPGQTIEIDDSSNPAIFLNPGLCPGTYDQRLVSAIPLDPHTRTPLSVARVNGDDAPSEPSTEPGEDEIDTRPPLPPSLTIHAAEDPAAPPIPNAVIPSAVEGPPHLYCRATNPDLRRTSIRPQALCPPDFETKSPDSTPIRPSFSSLDPGGCRHRELTADSRQRSADDNRKRTTENCQPTTDN